MAELANIKLSRLRLDPVNPRLADEKESQRQALAAMMEAQGSKLVALARDISKQGLSPIDRFLVLAAPDDDSEYIVLEGNRRLTALKLLLNPDLAEPILGKASVKTLRELAAGLQYTAESEMEAAVVKSRDEAVHWLRLRHGVGLDGAGTERWGTPEQERFDSRNGRISPELKIITFLLEQKAISTEAAESISITNMRRLLNDPDVRIAAGIEIDRKTGSVSTRYPAAEVVKPLTRIAEELAKDTFKVAEIYTKDDRADFLKRISKKDRPNPKAALPVSSELQVSATPEAGEKRSVGKRGRPAKRRATVAPTNVALRITNPRVKDVYRELQRLKVEDFQNAGGILIRVFLELTVDHYLKKKKIVPKKAELGPRMQAVHDRLLAEGVMSKNELAPIRKAISSSDLISASVSTFNLYVHSLDLSPSPNDVRTAWDNLQLFFVRIWK